MVGFDECKIFSSEGCTLSNKSGAEKHTFQKLKLCLLCFHDKGAIIVYLLRPWKTFVKKAFTVVKIKMVFSKIAVLIANPG